MKKGVQILIVPALLFGLIIAGVLLNLASQSEITPNDEFFVVSIGGSPRIDVNTWVLSVSGLVDNPLNLTYENITGFPRESEIKTLQCVDGFSGTASWTGVRLGAVLDLAGLKENATEVIFYGADGYTSSLTVEDAQHPDVLLGYEMNGEPLPVDQGYPLRVVAPGKYGYKWVKWVTRIEVVNYNYKGYWESQGWNDDADITEISEWWVHSILLSVSAYFGTLALISGLRFSKHVEFGENLPEMFSRRFHIGTSFIYLLSMLVFSIIWSISAFNKRGSFPNTNHGYLALIVMVLAVDGIISGLIMMKFGKNHNVRTAHLTVLLLGYLLLLGTILTGIIISGMLL